jgi:hypothetical protein
MLHSVGIDYLPEEDRLRIDVRSRSGDVHRFLLTRRVCALWLRDLEATALRSAAVPERLDPAAKATLTGLHHTALVQQAKFGRVQPSPEEASPAPQLLASVECGIDRRGEKWAIRFTTVHGDVLTLSLTAQTLHGIIELLRRQLVRTDWGLSLLPSADAPRADPQKLPGSLH